MASEDRVIGEGAGFGEGEALGATGAVGAPAFGLTGATTGFGAATGAAAGFGGGGAAATGFVWMGVTAGLDGGAGVTGLTAWTAGFGGEAGAGVDLAGGGVNAGFATGATAAGFALDAGGGPNVMRGRNGSAATRGNETGRLSGPIAGEMLDWVESRVTAPGHSKGRKSATAGSGGSAAGAADSTSPSRSSSPNPVVRNLDEVESFQRIAGEKSMAVWFNSAFVPFWFPMMPSKYSLMGRP